MKNSMSNLLLIPLSILADTAISAQRAASNPSVMMAQSDSPSISVENVYYQISGSTAEQLRASLNQLRPVNLFGQRSDSSTIWGVSWKYRYSKSSNSCQLNAIRVRAFIITSLPKWNPPPNTSLQLITRWNQYINAMLIYENSQKKYAVDASNEILATLKKLPTYPNCHQMGATADAIGKRIFHKYEQLDMNYDQSTRHGATLGVVFP